MEIQDINGVGNKAAPSNYPLLHGLDFPFMQVRAFHQAFDHPCPDVPAMQPIERATARSRWIEEECEELRDAETMKDQADAYTDILYFALGGMVELGIMPQNIFDCVQLANMAKLHRDPETGQSFVVRREDGKIVKPDHWAEDHAPERHIEAEIERQALSKPLHELLA